MALSARLKPGETIGDRVLKVDHAGEHGAISIYAAQHWIARWRAPDMIDELDHFLAHERKHRDIFAAELAARAKPRCKSFHFCGFGGLALGFLTGLLGRRAIASTTMAVERVVLRHLREQYAALELSDPRAATAIRLVIDDEQEHHDLSQNRLREHSFATRLIDLIVRTATEVIIWLGMKL